MSRDRSSIGAQASVVKEVRVGRRADYLEPAPICEILHEQLEYLIAHSADSCAPGCEDCVRLQQVQGWLLMPFRGRRSVRAGRAA
jgi:hypothetical protein